MYEKALVKVETYLKFEKKRSMKKDEGSFE